ncbi:ATP-binding protein [Rhodoferax sp.]|uniref:ATP-binding protein n=1 Tax=Rhodoferax sp. TaxID=50421 RepID=UPI002721A6B7|nr:ATP-binding protein [Rhodoferax sp.]MDO8319504.1 ATP-binding protein [Rhodoferax sp.]MDP2678743.1 ATP-binding protein [Rhodoferax sp.]
MIFSMIKNNLKFKVSVYLFVALSVATAVTTLLFIKHREADMQAMVAGHVMQIADVVVASTRYTMLLNKRDIAEKIIEDVGKQKGIERLRVISKDGTIIHSNRKSEIGYSVEQQDEPCIRCHQTSEPLDRVDDDKRWQVFTNPDGTHRVLTSMHAIRNEPTCASASCHEHPASQSVLGIVDIAYSLEEIDQSMQEHAIHIAGVSFAFILMLSFSLGYLLQRMIYLPLKDLEGGAKKISSGDLDQPIPVRSADEFGRVAGSFNDMTAALSHARADLNELIQELESKVEERSRELLAARAEVAQGEKLASIGVLAAGIAHELNNPLTGVLTFTSLMRKKALDGSEDAEDLDLIIRETKRCASIIRRLLDFAREKVPVKCFFSLNQVLEDTVRLVERPASLQKIVITMNLDPDLPQIWGDADLIKQVIMNILVNAQQAIDRAGSITVVTRTYIAKTSQQTEEKRMPMVELAIKDTGCGIPEANMQRIFDPFFTSKEVGKGTGLGLSVSYGIIKAHGGEIKVASVVGQGTTFHILLPITSPFSESELSPGEKAQ